MTSYLGERDRTEHGLLSDGLMNVYGGHRVRRACRCAVTSEILPAITAMSASGKRGGHRLARHRP